MKSKLSLYRKVCGFASILFFAAAYIGVIFTFSVTGGNGMTLDSFIGAFVPAALAAVGYVSADQLLEGGVA